MSYPDLFPSGPAPRVPALHGAELILSALAEAAITRRTEIGACYDCALDGTLCDDHLLDLQLARQYEQLYATFAAWQARVAIAITAGMN